MTITAPPIKPTGRRSHAGGLGGLSGSWSASGFAKGRLVRFKFIAALQPAVEHPHHTQGGPPRQENGARSPGRLHSLMAWGLLGGRACRSRLRSRPETTHGKPTIMNNLLNPFSQHFGHLEDPRKLRPCDHPLINILFITVCAVIAGADDWVEI